MDGTASFNANAAAKAAGATPFKRPENAQFLPGSGFRTFFFGPTGDTNCDGLHRQLNTLDSVWTFLVDGSAPKRFIALGRDPASEPDAAFLDASTPGFQNEGDNEPTGLHVSTGSTSLEGLPGTLDNLEHPRAFLTRQHGQNEVWEIVKTRRGDD